MTGKPTLPALIIRGVLDDLATIRELSGEPELVRDVAGGSAARLERALAELEPAQAEQECRDCGNLFPYDPDADYCPRCAAENAGEAPRCTCDWADDGDGESGPSPHIAELDPDCPDAEHRKAWREGEAQSLGHMLSLIEAKRRPVDEAPCTCAASHTDDDCLQHGVEAQRAEAAWEARTEASNR
jgi:hypothetical protein